jgi:hypothetical protein
MPRAYTIATAALTLRVPIKWLDNTLSHIRVAGVHQERQGVARRLSIDALLVLAIATMLINDLEIPLAGAIAIAAALAGNDGQYTSPEGLTLRLDLEKVRADLLERLENAVEIAPTPTRGRPPKTKTGRLD